MQQKVIDTVDQIITMPAVTGPIRTGDKEPMQNRQKDGTLYIKAKLSLCQKAADDLADLKFFPKSLANQDGTNLLRLGMDIALAGEDQKNLLGKTGKGANKVFDLPLLLNLIHSPNGSHDPLDGFCSFPAVLDDLKVVVLTRFFDSCKHEEPPELVTSYLGEEQPNVKRYHQILWHHNFETFQIFQIAA